ncbi:MAG: HDOD domain-containing protein [Planctomycetota bacterium]
MPGPSTTSPPPATPGGAADEKLKRVVQRIYDLPSFPTVIQKLQEVADNPKCTSKMMADVMEKDQGLSAKVLKLVNSAFYAFSKPVSSLAHAISLLGFNSIRSLAMSVSTKSLLKIDPKVFDQEKFWEHSLAVAVGARLIAEYNGFALKEDSFTAGLMHDAGILLEARYFPDEFKLVAADVQQSANLCAAEEQRVGVNHCMLGGWLGEKWRLPPLIREPMLRHHALTANDWTPSELEQLEKEQRSVTSFVTVANILANDAGFRHGLSCKPANSLTTTLPAHLAPVLGSRPREQAIEELRARFEKSRAFLTL